MKLTRNYEYFLTFFLFRKIKIEKIFFKKGKNIKYRSFQTGTKFHTKPNQKVSMKIKS